MLDHGTLTQEDIDIQVHGNELPNLGPAFHSPEALLDAVEHFTEHNALTASGAQPLTSYHAHNLLRDPEQRAIQREFERTMEEIQSRQEELLNDLDIDIDNEIDIDTNMALDEDFEASQDLAPATPASDGEDNPDPFKPDEDLVSSVRASGNDQHLSSQPLYLVTIYALATWLHLQWHLPRAACNALLSILSCLLIAICPTIVPPFVTLHSATKVLGLDMPTFELPCCPSCREVYPASGSLHTQDTCIPCQVPLFLPDKTMRSNKRTKKIPFVKYPYLPISMQLHSILTIPGIENTLDQWRTKPRARGQYTDIFDGDICRLKLKAPDGSLFFSNLPHEKQGPAGELRIGLNMGLDCILPGPKEQNPDQIQRFLRPIISDLLRLWRDGIKVPTESFPEGRLIRVVLVAVVCDKPAAHKVGGFGSHSHTNLCTCCWITQAEKDKARAFVKDAFKPRTNIEQRELGERYRMLTTAAARKNFVKEHATRYTQLSRLPYFDLVDQIIIDPMHNLFLGLVKTHFYNIWVQGKILRANHELDIFHEMLADFKIPGSCGKLPTDIGMPSGGSLTADQWLLLSTVYGPIVIPQLWSACLPETDGDTLLADRVALIARLEADKTASKAKGKQRATTQATTSTSGCVADAAPEQLTNLAPLGPEENPCLEDDAEMKFSLHPDDPANFLKLSGALRLLVQNSITNQDIDRADLLIREYCTELITLYGSSCLKPNHHYACHTATYARNFGPLNGFWTFLFERLNKVLKSFKTNNHASGELETTFFNEFHRTCQSSRLTYSLLRMPNDSLPSEVAEIMLKATSEERGTVAGLAALSKELDEAQADAHSLPLNHEATFFDYVVIGGKRYHASRTAGMNNSSLVHVTIPQRSGQGVINAYGEILELFRFDQDIHHQGESLYFARMRWFKRWDGERETIWDTL
ncbi:hypothetical protein PAXINDRAFT_158658 [Paxillus involutus ATCC 200175]|uniref:Transposase family Tnp2 protein n=1 Tax=Paxillus involutus ATCC 200175 TaxID=664439 RepID=A0A0C9T5Y5_PAXIN|nr:hypothetical protein PAXINDRAFT_158658 [Paxillus involutus ATCC 200175]